MALVGRSPIKVTAAPSTAPQEAMAASLQAHIDELVQKNRTCEHTIKRLHQTLADEKERGVEAVTRMKAEMQQEREEWREGCDSLLASHRIVHIRTRIELDKERLNSLLEKEDDRRERINILHRDYRLTLFQAKESELEGKVGALEDALEELTEEHEEDAKEYMAKIESSEKDLQKAERARVDLCSRLKAKEAELASIQTELSVLRKDNASLKAASESASTKLERTMLQLEGVKTNLAELEGTNAELKRTNMDLKRQMDRWQSLETKGGAEAEDMRKQKIELEVQVKELQSRVKDLEKDEKSLTKAVERERSKVEKLKKENDRMAEVTEEAQSIAKKAQDEYDETAKQLHTAQRLIEKLQSDKLPKGIAQKGKKPMLQNVLPIVESLDPSEKEVEVALTPAPKARVRPRPAYRGKDGEKRDDDNKEGKSSQRGKSRVGTVTNDKEESVREDETETEQDDENIQTQRSGKSQPRAKEQASKAARKRRNKSPVELDHDEEPEEEIRNRYPKPGKDKGKEKAVESPSDSEDEPRIIRKDRTKKRDNVDASDADNGPKAGKGKEPKEGKDRTGSQQSKSRKPSSSQGPRITIVDGTDEGDVQPRKKKKRLFPPSQAETFPWDVLPKGEGFAGLNIPTQLSPVKDTESVPARSVFGKVGSALGFK
ncbi:hypothetical protein ACEPAG_7143 [Sanghuangporus baumii]